MCAKSRKQPCRHEEFLNESSRARKRSYTIITTLKAGSAYHVTGDTSRSIQEELDSAVELARRHAMQIGGHGIMVTRLGPGSFTVAISAEVPYGVTHESCLIQTVQPRPKVEKLNHGS